jgi:hypothetical protein
LPGQEGETGDAGKTIGKERRRREKEPLRNVDTTRKEGGQARKR